MNRDPWIDTRLNRVMNHKKLIRHLHLHIQLLKSLMMNLLCRFHLGITLICSGYWCRTQVFEREFRLPEECNYFQVKSVLTYLTGLLYIADLSLIPFDNRNTEGLQKQSVYYLVSISVKILP